MEPAQPGVQSGTSEKACLDTTYPSKEPTNTRPRKTLANTSKTWFVCAHMQLLPSSVSFSAQKGEPQKDVCILHFIQRLLTWYTTIFHSD